MSYVGVKQQKQIMLEKTNPIETCMEQKNVLKCRRNAYGITNNPPKAFVPTSSRSLLDMKKVFLCQVITAFFAQFCP